jgi:hypothetical protein
MVQSIIELEAFSASVGDLIKEYDNKQNRIDGRVKWLRGRLKHLMQEAGQKTLKFPIGTAIVSTPKHGRVLLVSPDHVPEHYWRVKREPNLVLIEEALKNDQFVPGATLGKPEPRLTIRK